jgi:hypothetical protein
MRNIFEFFHQWKKERQLKQYQLKNPYRMLPADDGGASYRMECMFCLIEGSVMSPFQHDAGCPAGKLEEAQFKAAKNRKNQ